MESSEGDALESASVQQPMYEKSVWSASDTISLDTFAKDLSSIGERPPSPTVASTTIGTKRKRCDVDSMSTVRKSSETFEYLERPALLKYYCNAVAASPKASVTTEGFGSSTEAWHESELSTEFWTDIKQGT